ncbi:MAG: FliH/SctL family protein, partial [Gammaproteobacteria bacterium]
MLSSDAMRKWAAEFAAAAQAESAPRNSSRIISAERLAAYVPFAMAELGRETGGSFGDALESGPADRSGSDAGYAAGLEAGFADGRQRGFEAAMASAEDGRRQAEEQAAAVLSARIEALTDALAVRFEQVEREAADDVVALALDVVRQVLRSTLAVHPEAILPVVQEALAGLFEDRARMRLHLHPADAERVRAALSARLDTQTCEIVADPSVDAGGCRVVTP